MILYAHEDAVMQVMQEHELR